MNRKSVIKISVCTLLLTSFLLSIAFVFATPAPSSPTITFSPNAGCFGSTVTINGENFPASKNIIISCDTYQKKITSQSDGTFSVDFVVPNFTPGEYQVSASSGNKIAWATFTVTKIPTSLTVGFNPTTIDKTSDKLTIFGRLTNSISGKGISGDIQLSYWRLGTTPELNPLLTVEAGDNGVYRISRSLPQNTHIGDYIIVASFLGNDNYLPSTVESGPPNLTVLPEYLFSGLIAMAACFGAFIIVKKKSMLTNTH
jgi:hypothetical protein